MVIKKLNSETTTISIQKDRCNRCGKVSNITDTENGEIFCGSCGYVMSEKIEDSGPEYRNFMDGSDKSRAGAGTALSRHDRGLATIINPTNRDASGKPLSSSMKTTIGRLRIWDSRSQAHKSSDRNFRQAFNELSKLKDKLGLTEPTIEKTAYIYRKAINKNLARGRSIHSLLGASLYAACREAETPRTLRDIELVSDVKRKELAKCYRVLVEKLDLKIPVVNSIFCIARIANKIQISEKSKRLAVKILRDYELKGETAGKSPTGLAATALYLACVKTGEKFSQRDIASAANITEVTIRNRAAAIRKTLNLSDVSYERKSTEEVRI
ncbi:MAG: transcription initiation factor IIB family protein [Nitrosopumilaceae archaeon]